MADTLILDGNGAHFPDITLDNIGKAIFFGSIFAVGAFLANAALKRVQASVLSQ